MAGVGRPPYGSPVLCTLEALSHPVPTKRAGASGGGGKIDQRMKGAIVGRTIQISGHSDDTIVIEGNGNGLDEIGCYGTNGENIVLTGEGGQAVRLRVRYGSVWTIEAGPVEEDTPMLAVTIVGGDNGYSAKAVVEDVTTLIHESRAGE